MHAIRRLTLSLHAVAARTMSSCLSDLGKSLNKASFAPKQFARPICTTLGRFSDVNGLGEDNFVEEVAQIEGEQEKLPPLDEESAPIDPLGKRKIEPYDTNAFSKLKFDAYPFYIERAWWKRGHRMTFWATWRMLRDIRRREMVQQHGADFMRFKAMKTNHILPQAIIDEFQERMNTMPKRAYPNLVLNMCTFTGRERGKIKRFRVNRHIFRQNADHGRLSGVKRAYW